MRDLDFPSWAGKVWMLFLFSMVNLTIISIYGYLVLDSNANLNSRVGAMLLIVVLPAVLVRMHPQKSPFFILCYYGTGMILYAIAALIILGIPLAFTTFLLPGVVLYTISIYIQSTYGVIVKRDVQGSA